LFLLQHKKFEQPTHLKMPSSVLFIVFFFTPFKSGRWHPSSLAYTGNHTAILQ